MALVSAVGVREVVQRQREEGRQFLRTLLKWKDFDESRDLRQSILLDVIYESIVFAMKKGFPWSVVALVAKLSEELFHEVKGLILTIWKESFKNRMSGFPVLPRTDKATEDYCGGRETCMGVPVSEVMDILKDTITGCESGLTSKHKLIVSDYFIQLFIQHYHLYQFVLRQDQDVDQTCITLEIHLPPQPLTLNEGMDVDVWLYQQKVAELSYAEAQKRSNMLSLREIRHLEGEEILQRLYDELKMQNIQTLNRQLLEKMVKDAIGKQVKIAAEILQEEVKASFEILELRLKKKSLKPPIESSPPVSRGTTFKAETTKKSLKTKSLINK